MEDAETPVSDDSSDASDADEGVTALIIGGDDED